MNEPFVTRGAIDLLGERALMVAPHFLRLLCECGRILLVAFDAAREIGPSVRVVALGAIHGLLAGQGMRRCHGGGGKNF